MTRLPFVALAAASVLTAGAGAQPPVPDVYTPPGGYVVWAPGGAGKGVLVPTQFAREAVQIAACESGANGPSAVGDHGLALGALQVRRDYHAADMAAAGLDYEQESDRISWSVRLWQRTRWAHWSCRTVLR